MVLIFLICVWNGNFVMIMLSIGLYHAAVYYYQKGLEYPPAVTDGDAVSCWLDIYVLPSKGAGGCVVTYSSLTPTARVQLPVALSSLTQAIILSWVGEMCSN